MSYFANNAIRFAVAIFASAATFIAGHPWAGVSFFVLAVLMIPIKRDE